MRRLVSLLALALLIVAVTATAQAGLVFDRGLPTINLNNAAGANRSNVSWGEPDRTLMDGDGFTLPSSSPSRIDTIRVWLVNGSDDPVPPRPYSFQSPGDVYNTVKLYLGPKDGPLSVVSSGDFTGSTTTTNGNISISRVKYPGGLDYEGNSGGFYQIWQFDFNNLNLDFAAASALSFAVWADDKIVNDPLLDGFWYGHASNAALSGSPQDGADGKYSQWATNGTFVAELDSNGFGWDKSSDMNVQVFATAIPEPATCIVWSLLGAAAVAFAWLRRRRAAA